ncbi:16S rRNA (cytosine(967)-C(5))-methyltransferase RsmB [Luteimonas abyssi]|uniref:16S rRNA (cytosine(967)-C(5))-methyltransferase RsmB n=1 Tax=Luteimonas abyssi TaxID=1247514 RepID=UPI000737CD92|nr:16S rRNA (cytosine(967)-C(5))-methyltransferase RsmB [Luteimonas abyssi]
MARPLAAPGAEVRVAAARVLDAVLHRGRSLRTELASALPRLHDPRDRALLEAMCFSALRQRPRADAALAAWTSRPLGQRDGPLRALLHVGFAQLDPLGLPAHAALAATVEAARGLGRPHQAGMVNALLRRAQREGLPPGDPGQAWPAWLRERVQADWPDEASAIFAASATPAPMWLRVNRRKTTREAYRAQLDAAGIAAHAPDWPGDALVLPEAVPVARLPGFDAGLVSVQDGAAQAVADALVPPPGGRVLDACAAPGGKAAHLLERDPQLRLTVLDIDAARLARVVSTLDRLGLRADAAHVADAIAPDGGDWDGSGRRGAQYDAVLLDAPCSATGVVRRQPDILLHRRPDDLDALVATQAALLDACWRQLAPGGVLLYATCSILEAENAAQVQAFLDRTPDARAAPLAAEFGRLAGPGSQRLPGEDGMDGFFYARLCRAG